MSAAFLVAGVLAGIIDRLNADDLVNALLVGAKGSMGGAMVVGVARGVQWMLDKSGLRDPIIIPLADLVGITRQTATLAYQFGDGISNMAWLTYGTLLIILFLLAVVFLFIAIQINYT